MKKSNKYIIGLTLLILTLFISCSEVVNVEVPNGGNRLVVEASINWQKGTPGRVQRIKLSKSTGFFDNTPNTPVTGAMVTITKENDGMQFVFQDQNNGQYITTDFIPELNQTYKLQILYEGQTYIASETLIPVTSINTVEQGLEGEDEIQIKVLFNDPESERNYYLGEFTPSVLPLPTLAVLDDEFTNGNENFIEFDNEKLVPGAIVNINLYGISSNYYNYINLLIEQSEGNGGPFATTPAQLKGNCINMNNPNEEVLGYFRLGEVDTTSYVIK